jgi:hypothetical protein
MRYLASGVVDDKGGKPIFTKWSPYDARSRSLDAPPMRETESLPVQVPDAAELTPEARLMTRSCILAWQRVHGDRAAAPEPPP